MKLIFKAALTTIFILIVEPTASAVPVTVSSDLPLTYISQGSTVNGNFDINASLAGLGFSAPYSVTGGTMTFNFADNSDQRQISSSSRSYLEQVQACFLGACVPTNQYRWVINTTTVSYDPYEQVSVSSAGMTASAASPYFSYNSYGTETPSGHTAYSILTGSQWVQDTHTVCGTGFLNITVCQTYPVYTINNYSNWGYTGYFSVSMALNGAAITDLDNTGMLDFSLTGVSGDLNFLSASLDATVNDAAAAAASNSVPEPGILPVVLTGLGLLGLTPCRRRQSA